MRIFRSPLCRLESSRRKLSAAKRQRKNKLGKKKMLAPKNEQNALPYRDSNPGLPGTLHSQGSESQLDIWDLVVTIGVLFQLQ